MAMSGINVSQACIDAHDRQKGGAAGKKKDIQWTIYKISDDVKEKGAQAKNREVEVDVAVEKSFRLADAKEMSEQSVKDRVMELWTEFISTLPDGESRYAVFDYIMPTKSGTVAEVMRFVAWSPDSGKIKNKMIYSSTKDTIKKKLDVQKEIFLSTKNGDDIKDAFDVLMNAQ